jgi:hypothetical protein
LPTPAPSVGRCATLVRCETAPEHEKRGAKGSRRAWPRM